MAAAVVVAGGPRLDLVDLRKRRTERLVPPRLESLGAAERFLGLRPADFPSDCSAPWRRTRAARPGCQRGMEDSLERLRSDRSTRGCGHDWTSCAARGPRWRGPPHEERAFLLLARPARPRTRAPFAGGGPHLPGPRGGASRTGSRSGGAGGRRSSSRESEPRSRNTERRGSESGSARPPSRRTRSTAGDRARTRPSRTYPPSG